MKIRVTFRLPQLPQLSQPLFFNGKFWESWGGLGQFQKCPIFRGFGAVGAIGESFLNHENFPVRRSLTGARRYAFCSECGRLPSRVFEGRNPVPSRGTRTRRPTQLSLRALWESIRRMEDKPLTERPESRKRGGSKKGRVYVRLPLTSLSGLIKEAGTVYNKMKTGKLHHEEGRSLVWVLDRIRAMLEAQQLEKLDQRLQELGEHVERRQLNGGCIGHQSAIGSPRLPH
jgi:hypothetical protein